MSSLDDQIQSYISPVKSNADAVSSVLATADFRPPPDMPSVDGTFQNGRDLTQPPGTAPTVNAPPSSAGSATYVVDDEIELLHFGTGKIKSAVSDVVDPINQVADFLSAPGQKALGSPFLDQIFDQVADGSGYHHYAKNAHGMGDVVETVVAKALGFDMPDFVKTLITRVAAVHADFLRGV